jgi:tagatose 6-phosphate kinase
MIVTVTLNAALDKTHMIQGFRLGAVNLPQQVLALAGGKGINVARVLHALAEPVVATGIVAGHTGAFIESCLDREGIIHAFHRLAEGESRTCLAIVHPDHGVQTEVNEAGAYVSGQEFERFRARFAELLPRARWVALSGSMPPGLDGAACLELMGLARAAGKPLSLDTSGPALPLALTGRPDVFKPNQAEAEALLGWRVDGDNLGVSLERLLALGARVVALSLGAAGAAIATRDEAWFLAAPRVEAINPIGSGDSFLASLIASLLHGLPLAEAGAWAVAAGSANAAVPGAAACTRAQIEALVPAVRPCPVAEAAGITP